MTTEHTVASSDDQDQMPPRISEPATTQVSDERRWRFASAVHAARALNARPA